MFPKLRENIREWGADSRAYAAGAVVCAAAFVAGCETSPRITEAEAAEQQQEDRQAREAAEADRREMLAAIREADIMTLTAREAAKRIELEPEITDPLALREIKLYETLYHAAYTSNIGVITNHFLLEPPPSPEQRFPEGVNLSTRQLLLHVLARLDRLNVPMQWTPANASARPWTEPVTFPNTPHLATRLAVKLTERVEQDDQGRPRVRAELIDATAHVGGARQYATALWDGQQWQITRDRAFHVW